mgnify:CR=1 FL=1|jgi:hypothetical protein
MHGAADDSAELTKGRNETCRSMAFDLVCLIEHVRTCLRQIEQVIDRETSQASQESSANVVVLDDVSPRYSKITAALQACEINLDVAIHTLLESGEEIYA